MKKCFLILCVIFFSYQAKASCSYSPGGGAITVSFGKPSVLADSTLPDGTILAVARRGSVNPKIFSKCDSGDVYVVRTKPSVTPSNIKKINGQTVYETGIPGIGFQITDIIDTVKGRFTPINIDQPDSAINHYFKSSEITKQVMVWLIKTGPITQTKLSGYITVYYMAGTTGQTATGSSNTAELFRINIDLTSIQYKESTCNVTPRNGNIVRLQNIDVADLKSISSGNAAGKPKNFTLDINCPSSEINKDYIYWFNPISNTTPDDGVLLNSLANGAKNVGVIIKQGSSAIKFNDLGYTFKTATAQDITLTADYYKLANEISVGETGNIKVDFEIVLQEN